MSDDRYDSKIILRILSVSDKTLIQV